MKCSEIMDVCRKLAPEDCACDWDNPGLLAGRSDKEVKKIYIALDATDKVVEAAQALGADMLLTHHPLIFKAIKKVNDQNFITRRLVKLIQADISYYAMHTNYDVLGMAELSGRKMSLEDPEVLEVTRDGEQPEGIGRVADLASPAPLREICWSVKDRFHLGAVKVFGDMDQPVSRIAISPGSGKSMIKAALDKKADVLITGDIDHHTGIDAVAQGLAVIDAGHYGIEHIFIEDVKEYLKEKLEGVEVKAAPVRHPFQIV